MIIYNSTWSMLIQWIGVILSDLVNTKESLLPDFDKHYHTNNGIQQYWEEKHLRNYALLFKKNVKSMIIYVLTWCYNSRLLANEFTTTLAGFFPNGLTSCIHPEQYMSRDNVAIRMWTPYRLHLVKPRSVRCSMKWVSRLTDRRDMILSMLKTA